MDGQTGSWDLMPFWAKEKGAWDSGLGFKGKIGNSQVGGRKKYLVNKFLQGHPETVDTRSLVFQSATLNSYYPKVISLPGTGVFKIWIPLGRWGGGAGKRLFLSLLFLKNNQLKINDISKRHIFGWQTLLLLNSKTHQLQKLDLFPVHKDFNFHRAHQWQKAWEMCPPDTFLLVQLPWYQDDSPGIYGITSI